MKLLTVMAAILLTQVLANPAQAAKTTYEAEKVAECITLSEETSFEIFSQTPGSIKKGSVLVIVEDESKTSEAVVTNMNDRFVHIKLEDGRTIKFSENGGLKTVFNGKRYMCSNSINF